MFAQIKNRIRRHWAMLVAAGSGAIGVAPDLFNGLRALDWTQVAPQEWAVKIAFGLSIAAIFFAAINGIHHSDEGF